MEILSSRVLLRPTDFGRSVAFYGSTLGLAVYRQFPGGVVYFLGGGFLELSRTAGRIADDKVAVWLQVRDVDDAYRVLQGAAEIVEAPVDEPWGLREMRVRDPDGFLLVFVEVPDSHPLRHDPRE